MYACVCRSFGRAGRSRARVCTVLFYFVSSSSSCFIRRTFVTTLPLSLSSLFISHLNIIEFYINLSIQVCNSHHNSHPTVHFSSTGLPKGIFGQLELDRFASALRPNWRGIVCLRVRLVLVLVLRRVRSTAGLGVVGSEAFVERRSSYSYSLVWELGKVLRGDVEESCRSRLRVSWCAFWRHTRTMMIVG